MMTEHSAPIGVFDSGVGGLTVAREIIRNLPGENIVYFGDTARVPYGSKSRATVLRYSRQIVRFLKTKHVKAIVVACNTASALALEELEKEIDIPILGVVKPGADTAVRTTRNRRIGVIATESTINSRLYPELIREKDPRIEVFGKACPLFVPLVEEGWVKDPITLEVAKRYLGELQNKEIDTLILGCTHYPLLRNLLKGYLGEDIALVNPAYETAQSLKRMLLALEIANTSGKPGTYWFYASDSIEKFQTFAESILPCPVENAEQIAIESY
jgi:glutamate racemase